MFSIPNPMMTQYQQPGMQQRPMGGGMPVQAAPMVNPMAAAGAQQGGAPSNPMAAMQNAGLQKLLQGAMPQQPPAPGANPMGSGMPGMPSATPGAQPINPNSPGTWGMGNPNALPAPQSQTGPFQPGVNGNMSQGAQGPGMAGTSAMWPEWLKSMFQ